MRDGTASLTFTQADGGVRALWSFRASLRSDVALWRKPFAVYEGLVLRRQIGATYAQGLEKLKRVAETEP